MRGKIDGLLRNDSDVQPDTIHADTQGQSLPVFGVAALLGFELLPRIRNWHDLNLYRPDAATGYQHIDWTPTSMGQLCRCWSGVAWHAAEFQCFRLDVDGGVGFRGRHDLAAGPGVAVALAENGRTRTACL